MSYLVWLLIYLYGGSMLLAIMAFFSQAPIWLIVLNFLGILSLFLTPFHPYLLYLGLALLLLSAQLNGQIILDNTNLSHLIIRLAISLFLIVLYQLVIR